MKNKIIAISLALIFLLSIFTIVASAATITKTISKNQADTLKLGTNTWELQSGYDYGTTAPFDDALLWSWVWVSSNTASNNVASINGYYNGKDHFFSESGKGSVEAKHFPSGIDHMTGYAKAHHNGGANKTELTIK